MSFIVDDEMTFRKFIIQKMIYILCLHIVSFFILYYDKAILNRGGHNK